MKTTLSKYLMSKSLSLTYERNVYLLKKKSRKKNYAIRLWRNLIPVFRVYVIVCTILSFSVCPHKRNFNRNSFSTQSHLLFPERWRIILKCKWKSYRRMLKQNQKQNKKTNKIQSNRLCPCKMLVNSVMHFNGALGWTETYVLFKQYKRKTRKISCLFFILIQWHPILIRSLK